jgi:hypothetical protein
VTDTLVISSDDPRNAIVKSLVVGQAREYFALVDDRDSVSYAEVGTWHFSNARAYGTTSRYAYPAPGVSAEFSAKLMKSGVYQVQEIVPTTVNASDRARYDLLLDGTWVDSAFIDQNVGSGTWVTVLERMIPARSDARVILSDAMSPVVSGKVLRADALRFQWIRDGATGVQRKEIARVLTFGLAPNYPNPFNPETSVEFSVENEGPVSLAVYDVLGREVALLVNEARPAGTYRISWNAANMPSGIYFCKLTAGATTQTRKMVLMR